MCISVIPTAFKGSCRLRCVWCDVDVNGAFARVADNFDFQVVYGRCDCGVDVFGVETSKYEGTKVGVFHARSCPN